MSTFIHEPFAAIVGHYFTQGNKFDDVIKKLNSLDGRYVLTFDWGGGTLDITVVYIKDGRMNEMGTSELTKMAGDKFDEDIANFVWNDFCDKYGGKYTNEYLEMNKKRRWGKLLAIAERCKIELSKNEKTNFLLENVTGEDGIDIDIDITRKDFELLIKNVITAAMNKVDDALAQAGIQDINISHVLLTGGTCYIPAIKNAMKNKFGHRVETIENPDLLIAQGAAVISELGWLPYLTKDILIELSNDSFWPLFEHNTPLAAGQNIEKKEMFSCVDSTTKIAKVIIWEGIEQKGDKTIGVLNVPILNNSKWGDDIEVRGIIDNNIILRVSARSMLIKGYSSSENYSVRKITEINQLCFGLDING